MKKSERYSRMIEYFEVARPTAQSELNFENAFQLLVAVILSAQCTDKRVNLTTPALFKRFPTPDAMAESSVEEIFEYIKSISYPNNKSKHLLGMSQHLVKNFNGQVPDNMDDLTSLPGVGRKTANVILAVMFEKPAMAVDTHVFRVSNRIGLTNNSKTPYETEKELMKHIPEEKVPKAHHWLILHGRYVCTARKPRCEECGIKEACKFYARKIKAESIKNDE